MKFFWIVFVAMIVYVAVLLASPYFVEKPKVTEYKQQTSTTKPKDDEDDCSMVMCSAFGGGIVGDTMAIQYMNGD